MKKIPTIQLETRTQEVDPNFFVGSIVPIGMKYIEPKDPDNKDDFGKLSVLFLFESKLDSEDVIYVESLYELEDQLEVTALQMNPFNMDNWSDEFKKMNYNKVMEKYAPGDNVYGSDFTFTKTGANGEEEMSETAKTLLEGITTLKPDPYYTFEAVYSYESTNLDVIRKVHLDKGSWLQMSQFLYWIMMLMPISPHLFLIDEYKKAKFIEVNDMTYDACSEVLYGPAHEEIVMSHFTLFFDNTLNIGDHFGFNIPIELVEDKFLSQYVDPDEYIKAYSHDDTVQPDRVFMITSPDKMCCLLSGIGKLLRVSGDIVVFYLTPEKAAKLDWMNWSKYVYLQTDEDEEYDDKEAKEL